MFGDIRNSISLLSDSCVLLITLYTFYLKFWCKKISFIQYSPTYSIFEGDHLSVVIENHTLSPICLDEVRMIYGNKYKLTMVKYDEPQSIEPLKTFVVKMAPFSYLGGISFSELNGIQDKYLELSTSKGLIYTKLNKNVKIYKGNKNPAQIVMVAREFYNGHLIFPDTKYALSFRTKENLETIFINSNGLMSRAVGGFNAIPKEVINNKNEIEEIFKKFFLPLGISFILEEIGHNHNHNGR